MKVLSLKEPYASLIKKGIKTIETRSWKTNYRGRLYIHSSLTRMSKDIKNNQELMNLVDVNDLGFGHIICSCELVDCVLMTDEYIRDIKENDYNNYITGDYQVGRYGWVLKNIEVLDTPIEAKGKLGIWNMEI